jgi:hypothetical protein
MSKSRNRALSLLLSLSWLLPLGCAGPLRAVRSYPAPDRAELLAALAAHQARIHGMNAEARVKSRLGGQRARGTVQMLVGRAGALRFEAEVTLRGTVAALTTSAGRLTFIDYEGRVFREGPACPANVATLIGIPLAPATVAAILLGDAPLPAAQASAVEWDAARGADVLVFAGSSGPILRLGLRRPNPAIAAWDIVFLEEPSSPRGWRVAYDDFEGADGVALPRRIRFAEAGRDFDDGVDITIKERTLNPTFPDGAFLLSPPPGYAVEVSSCREDLPAR